MKNEIPLETVVSREEIASNDSKSAQENTSVSDSNIPGNPGIGRRELCKKLGLGLGTAAIALPFLGSLGSTVAAAEEGAGAKGKASTGSTAPSPSDVGFKDGKFVLPPLPYAYDALEPVIDKETVILHHDKHQLGYVKGANAAMEAIEAIQRAGGDAKFLPYWNDQMAFNVSGQLLHMLYWNGLIPGGRKPSGALSKAIDEAFGSLDTMEKVLADTAIAVQGSGWGILGWHPEMKKLVVLGAEKHQNLTLQAVIPLLGLDVWEHAYYLKYQNRRADYVKALLTIVNYENVGRIFEKAVASI